jgi:hypothetical protein
MPGPTSQELHHPTLRFAIARLEERLEAVVTYGAGGCPTCHDGELRGAIHLLKRMAEPSPAAGIAGGTSAAVAVAHARRRR